MKKELKLKFRRLQHSEKEVRFSALIEDGENELAEKMGCEVLG
jgi:hypothetical protein